MGNYNIVFFDAIDASGDNYVSGYVLKDEDVVGSTCTDLKVRPVDRPYPPHLGDVLPTAFTINMTMDDGCELNAVVESKRIQTTALLYTRWIGTMTGTVCSESYSGSALWEEFTNRI